MIWLRRLSMQIGIVCGVAVAGVAWVVEEGVGVRGLRGILLMEGRRECGCGDFVSIFAGNFTLESFEVWVVSL